MSGADETAREKIMAETTWALRQWQSRMTPEELASAIVSAPAISDALAARAEGYREGLWAGAHEVEKLMPGALGSGVAIAIRALLPSTPEVKS